MSIILSVIIPVYKVEDYLNRCVNSVLNQDYREIEVILVDDGSPDRCPEICDSFAKTDERVRVIHKQNGGLSSARNAGINNARGEYIAFLDSDDQWADGQLKYIMSAIYETRPQMAVFDGYSLIDEHVLAKRERSQLANEIELLDSLEFYKRLIESGDLHEQAGIHIISRDLVINNNLFFKEGIVCEDSEWFFRVLRIVNNVVIIPEYLQIYTENRTGSISNCVKSKNMNDLLGIIEDSIGFYQTHPALPTKKYELSHCAYLWSIVLGYAYYLNDKEIDHRLNNTICHLDLRSHPKAQKVYIFYKMFGLKLTSMILAFYLFLLKKNKINKKMPVNE